MNWFKKLLPKQNEEEVHSAKIQNSFDAKALSAVENRKNERNWFAVDPAVIYPATIDRIRKVLVANIYPIELDDPSSPPEIDTRSAGRIILNDANQVTAEGWSDSMKARNRFDNLKDATAIAMRAFALDVARRWFTQALHVQVGGDGTPMGLHILNNQKYKS